MSSSNPPDNEERDEECASLAITSRTNKSVLSLFTWRRYFQVHDTHSTQPYFVVGTFSPNYPYLLPLFRLTCTFYLSLLYILFLIYFVNGDFEFGKFFFFLTNLSVFALLCYFALTSIESFLYVRNPMAYYRRTIRLVYTQGKDRPLVEATFYLKFLQGFYAVTFTSNFFVSVMYWGLVFWLHTQEDIEALKFHGWVINVSIHGLNFCFALTDLFLGRQRIFFSHIIPVAIVSICYCVWSHIGHLIYSTKEKQWFVYTIFAIMSPAKRVVFYVAIFLASMVFFVFAWLLHGWKESQWPVHKAWDYLVFVQVRDAMLADDKARMPEVANFAGNVGTSENSARAAPWNHETLPGFPSIVSLDELSDLDRESSSPDDDGVNTPV